MSATKRQIDAYRVRLAKINAAEGLTTECIGAVVTVYVDPGCNVEVTGTLSGFTHRLGFGLFGQRIVTDVSLCLGCVHKPGGNACNEPETSYADVALVEVVRNGDREPVNA